MKKKIKMSSKAGWNRPFTGIWNFYLIYKHKEIINCLLHLKNTKYLKYLVYYNTNLNFISIKKYFWNVSHIFPIEAKTSHLKSFHLPMGRKWLTTNKISIKTNLNNRICLSTTCHRTRGRRNHTGTRQNMTSDRRTNRPLLGVARQQQPRRRTAGVVWIPSTGAVQWNSIVRLQSCPWVV